MIFAFHAVIVVVVVIATFLRVIVVLILNGPIVSHVSRVTMLIRTVESLWL